MDTLTTLNALTRAMPTMLKSTANQPQTERETAYYQSKIGSIKSIDAFLSDSRVFSYAMKAWGLEDMTYAKGLIRKVLEGGVDNPQSLANTLSGGKYRAFAQAFNFAANGANATSATSANQTTVDSYVRQQLEDDQGKQNPSVQLALYFQRKAPTIKSSLNILADKNLLTVVQTALGIPSTMSAASLDAQQAMIDKKINVADFQDPVKLNRFLQRYAASADSTSGTSNIAAAGVLLDGSGTIGLSSDLLMSIQKLR